MEFSMASPLAQAVGRFEAVTRGLSDADLEREWTWGAYSEGVRFAMFRTYEELRQLAATVAAQRAPQSMAQCALAQYHAAYRDLRAVLIGADDLIDARPAEKEWPARVILGHSIAVCCAFLGCARFALRQHREGVATPAEVPQQEIEGLLDSYAEFEQMMDRESMAGILAYFDGLHERVLNDLAAVGDAELDAPSLWWEGTPMPLQFRLHRFDSHLRQHTVQVEKTLVALRRDPSEARRLLRLIYAALAEVEGATLGAPGVGDAASADTAAAISARADDIARLLARS
jgi:hypothetical protein